MQTSLYKIVIIPILCISLLASCVIISSTKFFWFDELFSYYLVGATSYDQMMVAYHDKINNTPFVYFFIGWVWADLFGSSELSLRLFSSVTMCISAYVILRLLRHKYSEFAAVLSVAFVFTVSILILEQNAEARMYGLYLAFVAVACLLHERVASSGNCSNKTAVAIGLVHILILHTHLFGIFYSAMIIGHGIIVDIIQRRRQWNIYICYAIAWISLWLYLPTFFVQADAGNPRAWIPPPSLGDLAWFYTAQLRYSWPLLILAGLFCVWRGRGVKLRIAAPGPGFVRKFLVTEPTLALAWCFILLPIGIWLISLTVKPIFIDRYMMPTFIGIAILLAHAMDLYASRSTQSDAPDRLGFRMRLPGAKWRAHPGAPVLVATIFAILPILYALQINNPHVGNISPDEEKYKSLPVVIQYANNFLQQVQYRPEGRKVYVLDQSSAVSKDSGTWPPQEYKHMRALLRNFPERFAGRIVESSEFLNGHSQFLVWDIGDYERACAPVPPWYSWSRNTNRWPESLQCPRWLEEKILNNPKYSVEIVQKIETGDLYWGDIFFLLVQKVDERG